uniref:Uncharacterized protein n=1 Tax=Cacopsylla melanoneura TaxID=428564 RepID=A0A8D8YKW4_9HEMI
MNSRSSHNSEGIFLVKIFKHRRTSHNSEGNEDIIQVLIIKTRRGCQKRREIILFMVFRNSRNGYSVRKDQFFEYFIILNVFTVRRGSLNGKEITFIKYHISRLNCTVRSVRFHCY